MVVAEHQTAGRGRLDRTWETPPRSALTFSVLLRPTVPAARLAVAAAAGRVRRRARRCGRPGSTPSVKWPNDVLLGDRKVAGILVERVETADGPGRGGRRSG